MIRLTGLGIGLKGDSISGCEVTEHPSCQAAINQEGVGLSDHGGLGQHCALGRPDIRSDADSGPFLWCSFELGQGGAGVYFLGFVCGGFIGNSVWGAGCWDWDLGLLKFRVLVQALPRKDAQVLAGKPARAHRGSAGHLQRENYLFEEMGSLFQVRGLTSVPQSLSNTPQRLVLCMRRYP